MKKNFINNYISEINSNLNFLIQKDFHKLINLVKKIKKNKKKIIIAGNGGSAAMASHCCVDFTKTSRVRALNFNEADLITCFANDYGYENWVVEGLKAYSNKDDLVILVSSSGQSKNIVNAAKYCHQNNIKLVTFTGFKKNNPVKKFGDLNFWVDSSKYNIIEMTHHVWILMAVDYLSKK